MPAEAQNQELRVHRMHHLVTTDGRPPYPFGLGRGAGSEQLLLAQLCQLVGAREVAVGSVDQSIVEHVTPYCSVVTMDRGAGVG
ncbi:hypothetical protein HALA3H3_p40023 [Halomonas sp. A3H3]|nr:hypothetical protein HALA3H3_p40023 [Halomonas sp. A3H3]